ncbi:MAG: transaldolase [Chloroflexota bacterium]
MNALQELNAIGQSVWYDNVRRGLIRGGELRQMIEAGEITGVTSNPTIFERAIAGSTDYDDAIRQMADRKGDPSDLFEALAVEDIRQVADLLRPVYDRTEGRDGYVSIEVLPKLAHDAERTVVEARRLNRLIGRRNVMIKIPGTPAGIRAFEEATVAGINVNVTLLFSLDVYEQVARAYIRGLERRDQGGMAVNGIASVASFFVSRVDSAIDPLLTARGQAGDGGATALLGRAAIANARVVYARFKEIFAGSPFRMLAMKGALPQRPLWASTGTKNQAYSDVLYVDELVAPDTVNTMPPATIDACRDHGSARVTIPDRADDAQAVLEAVAARGVDLVQVTDRLLDEGLAAFDTSYDALLSAVAGKRAALADGGSRQMAETRS